MNRQLLIDEASQLFRMRGYHNTSMQDIAQACNIKKPSLYHHISSREALLLGVLEEMKLRFSQQVLVKVDNHSLSAKARLEEFAIALENFFLNQEGRCLVAKLIHEISDTIPAFMQLAKDFFAAWIAAIKQLLETQHDELTARDLAEDIVSQIQGALILGQLDQNHLPLKRATQRLAHLLK